MSDDWAFLDRPPDAVRTFRCACGKEWRGPHEPGERGYAALRSIHFHSYIHHRAACPVWNAYNGGDVSMWQRQKAPR